MAHTEGRVAKPERRWDCRRGTPNWTWVWSIRYGVRSGQVRPHNISL